MPVTFRWSPTHERSPSSSWPLPAASLLEQPLSERLDLGTTATMATTTKLSNPQRNADHATRTLFAVAIALTLSAGSLAAAPAAYKEPLDAQTLNTIKSEFGKLMELANRHDFEALHGMFWQSPSTLLVAKSAIPSEGNWAGFWGNEAIDQKLHDIGTSGPVVLEADYSKLKVVGLTPDVAESYAPLNITVSYAGQDGTPKPFLMIINWIRVGNDWKVASRPTAVSSGTRRQGLGRLGCSRRARPDAFGRSLPA